MRKIIFSLVLSLFLFVGTSAEYRVYDNVEDFENARGEVCESATDWCNTYFMEDWKVMWWTEMFCEDHKVEWVCKKFNNLKIFLSFILWWVTTFSLVWILWINLNFIKLDKVIDDIPVWIEQIQVNEGIGLQRTKSKNVEIWLMKMDADTSIDGSVEMEDSMIMEVNMAMDAEIFTEKTDLFIELEAYLETLGLNTEVINKILDIIRKYN